MRQRVISTFFHAALFTTVIAGCSSTPRHSNTLIFGTETKVALDASQDTTGGVGVTLGYKRHEAVWMPLLANIDSAGNLVPATCTSDTCRTFQGTTGTGGAAAGAGAVDTYSVLATFSGSATGGAGSSVEGGTSPGAKASGSLAQYFATGIAARLLAQTGGASIVNTAGESKVTVIDTKTVTEARGIVDKNRIAVERVMSAVTDKNGKLDSAKYSALVSKAKFSGKNTPGYLLTMKESDEIRQHLILTFDATAQPLFDALD